MNLRPVLDYDIDYLQGRILLAEPLNSTVADGLLVRGNALSGNEAYLVVRYEYSPGFEELDALSVGGQVHSTTTSGSGSRPTPMSRATSTASSTLPISRCAAARRPGSSCSRVRRKVS